MSERGPAILFYDGDCGLCNKSVRFLIARDKDEWLQYAPLQGSTAKDYLNEAQQTNLSTVIYHRPLADGKSENLQRSDAVLYAAIDIRSSWRHLAKPALWIPQSLRDVVYDWIAGNRHRFFKNESCKIPNSNELKRILP